MSVFRGERKRVRRDRAGGRFEGGDAGREACNGAEAAVGRGNMSTCTDGGMRSPHPTVRTPDLIEEASGSDEGGQERH